MKPEDLTGNARERYDTWRALGLSEASAMRQLVDDGLVTQEPFDEFVAMFRSLGMSESAARHAAIGRERGESAARRSFAETTRASQVSELATALTSLSERLTPQHGHNAPSVAYARARAKTMGDGAMSGLLVEAANVAFGTKVRA